MRRVRFVECHSHRTAAIFCFMWLLTFQRALVAQPPPVGYPPNYGPPSYGQDGSMRYPLADPTRMAQPSGQPQRERPAASPTIRGPALVAGIRITGNQTISPTKIQAKLSTRVDREFDPETVQSDVRELIKTGWFRDVRTYTEPTDRGVVVEFNVFELPTMQSIEFLGNRVITDRKLRKESGLVIGDALSTYRVSEARQKLELYYRSQGFSQAQVMVFQGSQPTDRGVIFAIVEGNRHRIWSVDFQGNTIASDGRLKTQIQSKPGFLKYFFKGKFEPRTVDEDVERIIAYYRGLGFFNAKVGRDLHVSSSGSWISPTFFIDEGPRYRIRQLAVMGNRQFAGHALLGQLALKQGEFFNAAKMQRDLNTLLDVYGSQGYVFADIKADPRFLWEPGWLDMMYNIDEGQQYRVGRINIHIAGEYPHTKLSVVRNRISLQPGDIIDIRKIRESERRLGASQLFVADAARGIRPRITVVPPDLQKAASSLASRGGDGGPQTRNYRGQSPDSDVRIIAHVPSIGKTPLLFVDPPVQQVAPDDRLGGGAPRSSSDRGAIKPSAAVRYVDLHLFLPKDLPPDYFR